MTSIIFINFHFLVPKSLLTKFGLSGSKVSEIFPLEMTLEIGPLVPKKSFEGFLPYMDMAVILTM